MPTGRPTSMNIMGLTIQIVPNSKRGAHPTKNPKILTTLFSLEKLRFIITFLMEMREINLS